MWDKGIITINGSTIEYWMKHYEEPSEYGIVGGRISKLMLKENGNIVLNYDRGWDIKPTTPNAKVALKELMTKYN